MKRRDEKKKSRRELYGQSTKERIKKTYDKSEGGAGGIFKEALPNVKFWKCKEGDHLIDIIPYFAGDNDPDLEARGSDTYKLEIFSHGNIGPEERMVICPARTYGRKCPICDHRKQLLREASEEEELIDSLKLSRYPRVIYNIICYDSAEEEAKGVQVWHTSSYLMERFLVELAKNPRVRGAGLDAFTDFSHIDADKGKSIAFTRKGLGMNTQFIGHKFVDRDYEISDEILETAFVLDDLIYVPAYDELKKIYWGSEENEEEESPKEKRRVVERERSERVKKEEETEEEDIEDGDEEELEEEKPARKRGRKSEPEPDDDDDEEEDEKPVVRKKKSVSPPKEEEDDDEEEEERPRKKKDKSEKKGKCPYEGKFGYDIDELEECEECEVWTKCAQEADRIEEEKNKKEPPLQRRRRKE